MPERLEDPAPGEPLTGSPAELPSAHAPLAPPLVSGDLRPTLFLLALPVLLEQFLSFGVGFVDTWLSGNLPQDIRAEATSAVGVASYVGWLASLLFGMVGIGTAALVARHWGAGDASAANRIANRSIALAAVLGLLVFVLLFAAAPAFAALLGLEGEARRIVIRYLRFDSVGQIFNSVSLAGAAALRGSGNMRAPMMILGFVSVCNIAVSATLVFGAGPFPALGVDGIIAGTLSARLGGGLLMLLALARGLGGIRLARRELVLRGSEVGRILRVGVPAALDGLLMWTGHFLFLMIVSALEEGARGTAVFAAHVVGIEIEAITYLPAVAWGYAAATMVGQSLGAQRPGRAGRVGHEAALQCSLLAAAIALVFFVGAEAIYGFMHRDALVREIGAPALRLLALFQVPLVWSIVYVHALRGAGDTRTPMYFTAFGVFCVRLPLAYLLGIVLEGGLVGAWIGMGLDVTVRALLAFVRYRRGKWVRTVV